MLLLLEKLRRVEAREEMCSIFFGIMTWMDGIPIRKGNSGRGGVKSRGNPAAGFCRSRPDVRVGDCLEMRGPRIRGVGRYIGFKLKLYDFFLLHSLVS